MSGPAVAGWGAVVPVQRLTVAKSRLAPYGPQRRAELALAFAADVVTALLRCPPVRRVVVVTADARVRDELHRTGVEVVRDRPGAGLNAALRQGEARLRSGDRALGVLAVTADLPALTGPALASLLDGCPAAGSRSFVADADGIGTTLLLAGPAAELAPAYGPASRARHRASGARELAAAAGLRRDVDTPDDLHAAVRLGVGERTAAAVAALVAARAG